MNVIYHKNIPSQTDAEIEVNLFYVEIGDVDEYAASLIRNICDTSWISELKPVAKKSYRSTAEETIRRLVAIFESANDSISKDFGQYMVSLTAGTCLNKELKHNILPISELWKEKVSHNHGFDFHSESPNMIINFGESKYSKKGNPYSSASEQVLEFIKNDKDSNDLVHLEHFVSSDAVQNFLSNKKAYTIAFSLNSGDYERILGSAVNSKAIKKLKRMCKELFIVGIKP